MRRAQHGRGPQSCVGGAYRDVAVWCLHKLMHEVKVPLVEPGDRGRGDVVMSSSYPTQPLRTL